MIARTTASHVVVKDTFLVDKKLIKMEAIGHFRLLSRTCFYLDLKDFFVIMLFGRNLIYIFLLDKFGYFCLFENNNFCLFLNSNIIDASSISIYDNFYIFIYCFL